jgi:hypothetical protein
MILMATPSALNRLLEPLSQALTPEAARCLADFRIDPALQARIDELADRCNEGLLTEAERSEYEDLVDGISLISILKSKAHRVLSNLTAV